MIFDLPKAAESESRKYWERAALLSKDIVEQYDTKELKDKISLLFQKFQNISSMYQFPREVSISSNLQLRENMFTNNVTDKVGNLVIKIVDEQIWATKFYYKILEIASKLTHEECVYMIDTFFRRITEENLSEKLGICRNTLKKIKKSCLIKMWANLEDIC